MVPPELSRRPGAQPMNVQMKPPVSAEELKRRREALENAVTANRLEGLKASPEVQSVHDLWAEGHITNAECDARVQAIFDAEHLKQAEASRVQQRLLHIATKGPTGPFTFERLCETHRYLFQDVYDWAGQPRSGLRMFAKRAYEGGPYHHFTSEARIASEAKRIFDGLQRDGELKCLDRATFADKASTLFVEINQLHPFREGNGRAQVQFVKALAERAGQSGEGVGDKAVRL